MCSFDRDINEWRCLRSVDNSDQRSETSTSERRLTLTSDDETMSLVSRQMQQLQEQQKDLEYREQLLRDQQLQLANSIGQQQQGLKTHFTCSQIILFVPF
jgi:hypothetical protein